MSNRSNNGVPSKVTNNAQTSVGGQMGSTRDNGGAPNQTSANLVMADMASHHGPAGSSGTVKDMGGVGDNKGSNGPANDFRQAH